MDHLCKVSCYHMPITHYADYIAVKKPLIHIDRVAQFEVMIYLVKGKMFVIEDGVEYVLTPGTVFFLKSHIHHWGEKKCEADTAWYYIHFNSKVNHEDSFVGHQEYTWMTDTELKESDYKKYFELPKILTFPTENTIEKKVKNYVAYFKSLEPGKLLKINMMLFDILVECYEYAVKKESRSKTNRHIVKILNYLEEHYTETFSMEKIGDAVGLNYKYASDLFKKETGQLIRDYYMHLKIEKAERLLCDTDLSISEISNYLGFLDQFYFSNVFKKYKGISPRKFRTDGRIRI